MTAIYGHKWTSQYGECDEDGTWARGLSGLSGDEMAAGLGVCIRMSQDRVRTGDEDWPPTLGQFRAYCKTRPPVYNSYQLPKPPDMTLEEKEKWIAELRKNLR